MLSYMFDTNVFNRILDGIVDVSMLHEKVNFFATHVQFDEIKNTSNNNRRQALIEVFEVVIESNVPTDTFVLDYSRLDEASLTTDEDRLYDEIKAELDELNKNKPNNVQDALITDTAIKKQFTLVTEDSDLIIVARKFGCKCVSIKQMLAECGNWIST